MNTAELPDTALAKLRPKLPYRSLDWLEVATPCHVESAGAVVPRQVARA